MVHLGEVYVRIAPALSALGQIKEHQIVDRWRPLPQVDEFIDPESRFFQTLYATRRYGEVNGPAKNGNISR